MVCARENNVKKSVIGRNVGVLSKLICKAEKRKIAAENYHIYAVLQSTILKLKMESKCIIQQRRSSTNCTRKIGFGTKNVGLPKRKVCEDPLELDSFFRKLADENVCER